MLLGMSQTIIVLLFLSLLRCAACLILHRHENLVTSWLVFYWGAIPTPIKSPPCCVRHYDTQEYENNSTDLRTTGHR